MSEIKFRAWDADLKKMFYAGDNSTFADTTGRLLDSFADEHLMPFTGLKDKNGRKIYLKDIVRIIHPQETTSGREYVSIRKGEVVRHESGAYQLSDEHATRIWSFPPEKREVLGNIYDNPELLEQ